jgi:tRNA/rRNA methyltransferase
VNDYRVPLETARSAVGAADLLAAAVEAASVAEAVAGCSLVVGTTAVGERAMEHRLLGLVEAAEEIRQQLSGSASQEGKEDPAGQLRESEGEGDGDGPPGSVALLFGSEKTGLTNEALSHCDWLLTVPLYRPESGRHLSMNLGQAVAVCLWELVRGAGAVESRLSDPGPRAKAEEVERVVEMLRMAMRETEYNRRFPASCDENTVRRLVHRMGLGVKDAQAWMGILRQVLWKVKAQGEERP